jgi:hypothetical protein
MRDVFSSLPGALRGFSDKGKAREAIVFAAWNRAVGIGLGEHTSPVGLEGKRLTVAVSSDTWKKHVGDLADQILFKLNGALGSSMVSYIEFTVDARYVRKQNKPPVRSKSEDEDEWKSLVREELTSDLKTAATDIEDEALRQLFLNASTSSLARQRLEHKEDR